MIRGIGCDLVEIARIARASKKSRFLANIYSENELEIYYQNNCMEFLAGNFAAKEAIVKAAGIGFRGFLPREIEILRNDLGAPYVVLSNIAKEKLMISEDCAIHISISNIKKIAMAMAIISKNGVMF